MNNMYVYIFIISLLFSLILPVTNLQLTSAASLITVPTDFPTIQAAIDAASSGSVIKILPGIYSEQITIDKNLLITGSGAKSTIITAPTVLDNGELGLPYIIQINNKALVNMKDIAIRGLDGENCNGLFGITVLGDATLNLDSAIINQCTRVGILVGSQLSSNGPQFGHATITKTFITDYQARGVFAVGEKTTLTMLNNKVVGTSSDVQGMLGILFVLGATGKITNNEVNKNICDLSGCGEDYFEEIQAFGIAANFPGKGSVISNNQISDNDIGIGLAGENNCCKILNNKLTNNKFFGMVIDGGEHKSINDKISGGNVGVAAVGIFSDTIATLINDKITGTTIKTQELSCCGSTAKVVTIPSTN